MQTHLIHHYPKIIMIMILLKMTTINHKTTYHKTINHKNLIKEEVDRCPLWVSQIKIGKKLW